MAGVDYQLYITANIKNTEEIKAKLQKLEDEEINLNFNTKDSDKLLEKINKQKDIYRREVDKYLKEKMALEEKAYKKEQAEIEKSRKAKEQANKEDLARAEKSRKANEKAEKEKRKSRKETEAIAKKAEKERQKEAKKSADTVIAEQIKLNKLLIQEAKIIASTEDKSERLPIIQYEIEQQEEKVNSLKQELMLQESLNEKQEYENKLAQENLETAKKIQMTYATAMDKETTKVQRQYFSELEKAEKKVKQLNLSLKEETILLQKISTMHMIPPNSDEELTEAKKDLEQLNNEIIKASKSTDKFAESMSKATATAIGLGSASMAIMTLTQAMTALIQTSYELNKQMTQLAMITGKTSSEMDALASSYTQMAMDLGATTSQIMSAADEFLRQGHSVAETNELIEASLVLSKTGMMEASDAATKLTAALNGFKLEASDAMMVVDKLVALDINAATSANELATALKYVAQSAQMAGVELDHILGYLTTILEVSRQAPEMVGTAMRTILTRMNQVKAGVATDEVTEAINNTDKVLQQFGIHIVDTTGDIKEADKVLTEVAKEWDNLTDAQQNQVAGAMAGTHQREQFIILMENYATAIQHTVTAMNSAGTAQEQMNIYLESTEAHLNKLIAQWQLFAVTVVDEEMLNFVLDLGTAFLGLANAVPILSDLAISFAAVAASVAVLKMTVESLDDYFDKKGGREGAKGWGKQIDSLTKKANKLFGGKSTKAVAGWAGLAVASISVFINSLQRVQEEIEATQQAAVDASSEFSSMAASTVADAFSIETMTEEFLALSEGVSAMGYNVSLTEEEFAKYNEMVAWLIEKNPELEAGINAAGDAYIYKTDAIEKTNEALKENLVLEAQSMAQPYKVEDFSAGLEEDLKASYDTMVDELKAIEEQGLPVDMTLGFKMTDDEMEAAENLRKNLEEQLVIVEQLKADAEKAGASEASIESYEQTIALINEAIASIEKYEDATREMVDQQTKGYLQSAVVGTEGFMGLSRELQKMLALAVEAIEPPDMTEEAEIEAWTNATMEDLETLTRVVVENEDAIQGYIDTLQGYALTGNATMAMYLETFREMAREIEYYAKEQGVELQLVGKVASSERATEMVDEVAKILVDGMGDVYDVSTEEAEKYAKELAKALTPEELETLLEQGEQLDWEEILGADSVEEAGGIIKRQLQDIIAQNEMLSQSIEEVVTSFETIDSVIDVAISAQEEYNQTGMISIDTFNAMISAIQGLKEAGLEKYLLIAAGSAYSLVDAMNLALEVTKAEAHAALFAAESQAYQAIMSYESADAAIEAAIENSTLASTLLAVAGAGGVAAYSMQLYNEALAGKTATDSQTNAMANMNDAFAKAHETISSVEFSSTVSASQEASEQMAQDAEDVAKANEQAAKEAEQAWHDAFNQQYTALNHYYTMGEISAFEYYNELARLTEEYYGNSEQYLEDYWKYEEEVYQGRKQMIDDFYQGVAETAQWAIDQEIEALEEANEVLEDQLDVLEKQKDGWEATVDYATSVIDDQIKVLEDQKRAIQNANEEMEDTNELLKLQNDLYNAQNEQIRVYSESQGFYYTANQEAVDEAQKAVDEYNVQQVLDEIDKQIEAWEAQKEAWESVVDSYIQEQNRLIAAQMFGYDITYAITSGQSQMLIDYATVAYETTMEQIKYIEAQIEANNQEIESLQELNDAWANAADAIQIAQYEMMMNSQYLADFEQQTFEERMKVVQQFTDDYINAMKDIEDAYMTVYDLDAIELPSGATYSPKSGTSGSTYSSSPFSGSSSGESLGDIPSPPPFDPDYFYNDPDSPYYDPWSPYYGGSPYTGGKSVGSQSMNKKSEMQVISHGNAIEDVFSWSKLPMTAMTSMFKQISYQLNKSSEMAQTKQPNNYYFNITGVKNLNEIMAQAERYVLTTGSYM